MMYFDHGKQRYRLSHNNSDDSRSVVRCGPHEPDFANMIRFDSSLNVLKGGEQIGRLSVNYDTDEWTLVIGEEKHGLSISCNDYSWQKMMLAEVAAAKLLLE